jgi:hypothetical protein
MEAKLSAGIVSLKAANLNIPEADCCGEAVELFLIRFKAVKNSTKGVFPPAAQ